MEIEKTGYQIKTEKDWEHSTDLFVCPRCGFKVAEAARCPWNISRPDGLIFIDENPVYLEYFVYTPELHGYTVNVIVIDNKKLMELQEGSLVEIDWVNNRFKGYLSSIDKRSDGLVELQFRNAPIYYPPKKDKK